jgi:hypothetical protein
LPLIKAPVRLYCGGGGNEIDPDLADNKREAPDTIF